MSTLATKHPHYHKDVRHLETIDVYRVLSLFNVTDPCLQHAIKKLLVAGGRGAGKSMEKDLRESVDSINRALEMLKEDSFKETSSTVIPANGVVEVFNTLQQRSFSIGDKVGLNHSPGSSGWINSFVKGTDAEGWVFACIDHKDGKSPSIWRTDKLVAIS